MNTPTLETMEPVCGIARRLNDEPEALTTGLLAINENEALRAELRSERWKRKLAEGEVARMKMESTPKDTFMGLPLRSYDASDDDCRRISWDVKIDGVWHEIITCGLRFDRKEAIESLCRILMSKI